jgi:hypothetical protein
MIYTAPCVIFLMRADALRGEVGPSEIARADRRVQFWAQFPFFQFHTLFTRMRVHIRPVQNASPDPNLSVKIWKF